MPTCSSWLLTTWPQAIAYGRAGIRSRSVGVAVPDSASSALALAWSYGKSPVRSSYQGSVGGTMLPISVPFPPSRCPSAPCGRSPCGWPGGA